MGIKGIGTVTREGEATLGLIGWIASLFIKWWLFRAALALVVLLAGGLLGLLLIVGLLASPLWPLGLCLAGGGGYGCYQVIKEYRERKREIERQRRVREAEKAQRRVERRSMGSGEKAVDAGKKTAKGISAAGRATGRAASWTGRTTAAGTRSFSRWRRDRKVERAADDLKTVEKARAEGLLDSGDEPSD